MQWHECQLRENECCYCCSATTITPSYPSFFILCTFKNGKDYLSSSHGLDLYPKPNYLVIYVPCSSGTLLFRFRSTWELKLKYNNFLLSINTIQEIKKSPHTNTNANEWWWRNLPSVFQKGISTPWSVWVFAYDILQII